MSRDRNRVLVIAAAALWTACCSTSPPAPDVTAPEVESTRESDCAALGELACLDSLECTLRQAEAGSYVCGQPASDCEIGFSQRSARAQDCAEGCTFVPPRCYCSPDVTCVCGGGPPAQCLAPQ